MDIRYTKPLTIAALLLGGCSPVPSGPRGLPVTAPGNIPSQIPPGTFPASGQPVQVGVAIPAVVTGTDAICTTSDPGVEDGDAGLGLVGPCKTFAIPIVADGVLEATVTWSDTNVYLTALTRTHGVCCSSPLTWRSRVARGDTVILGVGLHAPQDASAAASFILVTRLTQ